MSHSRIRDVTSGTAMIVTDLHGADDAYQRMKETFLDLHAEGHADKLILCGDLLHGYGSADDDASLSMLLDVMQLQAEMGDDTVMLLLGNHEFPHIYSISLAKGKLEFTSRFEHALESSGKRDAVITFLRSLPFYVRTAAGVTITHAGASPVVQSAADAERLDTIDHAAILQLADDKLAEKLDLEALRDDPKYQQQVQHYLAVSDTQSPRYTHLLRGQLISQIAEDFEFMWETFFAYNEKRHGDDGYQRIAENFLQALSAQASQSQRVIVAGHIGVSGGHRVVNNQHLRLASYAHANPPHAGKYLLLDCDQPIDTAEDLVPQLRPLFA